MRKISFLIFVFCFFLNIANAGEIQITGGYDYYLVPNSGNNYGDGQGFSIGIQHPIIENLSGRAEFSHITDVEFPEERDPKGAWGEMRGNGFMYSGVYRMPYSEKLSFNISVGAGFFVWDFREYPWLQDHNIEVDLGNSIALKAMLHVEYKLKDGWIAEVSGGWFDTNISKDIKDNPHGIENILDADGNIGFQAIPIRAGIQIKKKF